MKRLMFSASVFQFFLNINIYVWNCRIYWYQGSFSHIG